jgi:hypothetical protein
LKIIWSAVVAGVLVAGAASADTVRLRSRAGGAAMRAIRPARPGHFVLEFRSYPGREIREELRRRGFRVLGYVPDSGLMVSGGARWDGLGVTWAGVLSAEDKISAAAAETTSGMYVVRFHADVEPERARSVAAEEGFEILTHPDLLPGHLLLGGSFARIAELAARDEVAHVIPASAELISGVPVIPCAGAAVEAGPVAEYALVGRGWSKGASGVADLRYVFQSFPPKLDAALAKAEMERALREWQRYAAVSFTPGTESGAARTIAILFARRAHGDGFPFDGPGAVLAHTYYPSPPNAEPIAGDMHLDAEENWQVGAGVDVFTVALHEAGHALGLGHSSRPGSVMYPYYRQAAGLSDDDIAGVRDLYGSAGAAAPPQPPQGPPTQPPVQPPPPPPAPPVVDSTAPAVRIVSPSSSIVSTTKATIRLNGTATDNIGVSSVKWSTSTGASGVAVGSGSWSADVPVLVGNNVVTVRAYDAAGNSGWRAVTVVRK